MAKISSRAPAQQWFCLIHQERWGGRHGGLCAQTLKLSTAEPGRVEHRIHQSQSPFLQTWACRKKRARGDTISYSVGRIESSLEKLKPNASLLCDSFASACRDCVRLSDVSHTPGESGAWTMSFKEESCRSRFIAPVNSVWGSAHSTSHKKIHQLLPEEDSNL